MDIPLHSALGATCKMRTCRPLMGKTRTKICRP